MAAMAWGTGVGGGSQRLGTLVLAGLAGLIGGALSMAVGEFISVSSQRDAEAADVQRERDEQAKGELLILLRVMPGCCYCLRLFRTRREALISFVEPAGGRSWVRRSAGIPALPARQLAVMSY